MYRHILQDSQYYPFLTKKQTNTMLYCLVTRTMPFTYEEKCFITIQFSCKKKYKGAKRVCSKYRQKKWSVSFVNDLLRNIDKTGSVERKAGLSKRNQISRVFLSRYAVTGKSSRNREVIVFM